MQVPLSTLWHVTPDVKALSALTLYRELQDAGRIPHFGSTRNKSTTSFLTHFLSNFLGGDDGGTEDTTVTTTLTTADDATTEFVKHRHVNHSGRLAVRKELRGALWQWSCTVCGVWELMTNAGFLTRLLRQRQMSLQKQCTR
eukprot:COSAG01_NODE_3086_length_6611_cov_12.899109_3_plen_142_part_00